MTNQSRLTKEVSIRREFLRRLLILLLFVYASFAETLAQGADATYGTAVAAYRTENEIVVAADSRAVRGDGTFYVGTLCKRGRKRGRWF